jgi:hypothetical protein
VKRFSRSGYSKPCKEQQDVLVTSGAGEMLGLRLERLFFIRFEAPLLHVADAADDQPRIVISTQIEVFAVRVFAREILAGKASSITVTA